MRGLTIRQPWAGAVVWGGKGVENRTRSLGPYRGPVAIHGGLQYDGARAHEAMSLVHGQLGKERFLNLILNDFLVLGHILGVADLVDVHEAQEHIGCHHRADVLGWVPVVPGPEPGTDDWEPRFCSPWGEREQGDGNAVFHHVLANPRPLLEPIPYRGALGLWRMPESVVAEIEKQLAG